VASFGQLLGTTGVFAPFTVMISLLDVRDYMLATSNYIPAFDREFAIDRDDLVIPEVVIADDPGDYWRALRPAFDSVWRAANRPGCPHYLDDGSRDPKVIDAAAR
jgi:hypothetical protein